MNISIGTKSRIAFDVHGVLDTYKHFVHTARMVQDNPHQELIIISGQLFDYDMQQTLKRIGISQFAEYHSITQHLLDNNPGALTWIDGKPYADDLSWNPAKAIICENRNISMLYDDSTEYERYFSNIPTLYIQVHNGKWTESGRESK